jgi:hypothetical protein
MFLNRQEFPSLSFCNNPYTWLSRNPNTLQLHQYRNDCSISFIILHNIYYTNLVFTAKSISHCAGDWNNYLYFQWLKYSQLGISWLFPGKNQLGILWVLWQCLNFARFRDCRVAKMLHAMTSWAPFSSPALCKSFSISSPVSHLPHWSQTEFFCKCAL